MNRISGLINFQFYFKKLKAPFKGAFKFSKSRYQKNKKIFQNRKSPIG